MYNLYYTNDAYKDFKKVKRSPLEIKILNLLEILKNNPWQVSPPYKKLQGINGAYSRRINLQHRLFYEVDEIEKRIKILRMWKGPVTNFSQGRILHKVCIG